MNRLVALGWRVVAVGNADQYVSRLTDAGIEFEEVTFNRSGLAPRQDSAALLRLTRLYRRLKPDLIHHCQGKPVILGCAAARLCPSAKVVNTITGLGHAFIAGGPLRRLACSGYRHTLGRAARTIFENIDDLQLFVNERLVSKDTTQLMVFSGIDVERFRPTHCQHTDPYVVSMPARLLWEKGVAEFVEAARICRDELPNVRFQLAGEVDQEHPSRIDRAQVDQWVAEGLIEYSGYVHDMRELYAQTTVVVLPSYREGVPRVLLEASACGIPIVTCDTPGCRVAIKDQRTGLMVPPKDPKSLAGAILKLLSNAELRSRMGQAGRQFVEEHFDQRVIADRHLELYRQIGIQIDDSQRRSTYRVLVA
jgi:glycosyltransferase involved in cell wall biosynthesis